MAALIAVRAIRTGKDRHQNQTAEERIVRKRKLNLHDVVGAFLGPLSMTLSMTLKLFSINCVLMGRDGEESPKSELKTLFMFFFGWFPCRLQ